MTMSVLIEDCGGELIKYYDDNGAGLSMHASLGSLYKLGSRFIFGEKFRIITFCLLTVWNPIYIIQVTVRKVLN